MRWVGRRVDLERTDLIRAIGVDLAPPAIAALLRQPTTPDFVGRVVRERFAAHTIIEATVFAFDDTIVIMVRAGMMHSDGMSDFMAVCEKVGAMPVHHAIARGQSVAAIARDRRERVNPCCVVGGIKALLKCRGVGRICPRILTAGISAIANGYRDDIAGPANIAPGRVIEIGINIKRTVGKDESIYLSNRAINGRIGEADQHHQRSLRSRYRCGYFFGRGNYRERNQQQLQCPKRDTPMLNTPKIQRALIIFG